MLGIVVCLYVCLCVVPYKVVVCCLSFAVVSVLCCFSVEQLLFVVVFFLPNMMFVFQFCRLYSSRSYHDSVCSTGCALSLHRFFVVFGCLYLGYCFCCYGLYVTASELFVCCLLSVLVSYFLPCVVFLLEDYICRVFAFVWYVNP